VVTPVDPATAGAIIAQVRFAGPVPTPVAINMAAAGRCADLHPEPVFDQPVQSSGGKLADTLVYIESGLGERTFRFPTEPVVINQRGCLYHPRSVALMVGQPLEFHNSDPEAHNVHGRPVEVHAWNFMMSRPGATRTLYFDAPEIGIRVGCDIHPWMRAYVSVLSHPYFGVSDRDGTVKLTNVPPGHYVVAAWHPTLGERRGEVTLAPGGTQTVNLQY